MWEKGGSGLVFYTDASYWDQQDGGEAVFFFVGFLFIFLLLFSALLHTSTKSALPTITCCISNQCLLL